MDHVTAGLKAIDEMTRAAGKDDRAYDDAHARAKLHVRAVKAANFLEKWTMRP